MKTINEELLEACKSLRIALSIMVTELKEACPDRKVNFNLVLTLLTTKDKADKAIANAKDVKPKPKPLAQYLDEYIQHEVENLKIGDVLAYHCACCMREVFEQALDAYESTENVSITIKAR